MATVFIRAFLLYLFMMLTLRGMGKRQLGQYQPYELTMAMLMADLLATPISDVSTPLLHGLLPIGALFITHSVISLISMRSDTLRAIISGKPRVLVSNGVIDRGELTRLCLSLSDLLEGIRSAGILDPSETGTAIMEANGKISAFPAAAKRPPHTDEMNIDAGNEGLPLTLIMDGRLQPISIQRSGLTENALEALLANHQTGSKCVYLACLNTKGELFVQEMGGRTLKIQVMPPEKVAW